MALSTTRGSTNYARICRLLIDGGAIALRIIFDGIHPPAKLQVVLSTYKSHLDKLKKEGFLKDAQWKLLFPTAPGVHAHSSNFDVTLLVLLLSEICGLPRPHRGWNALPLPQHCKKQDDIARIKFFRNKFAHPSEASLKDPEFSKSWKTVRDALVRLGAKAADIDQLKDASMDFHAESYITVLKQWCLHEQNAEVMENLNKKIEEVKKDVMTEMKSVHDNVKGVVQTLGTFREEFIEQLAGISSSQSSMMAQMEEALKEVQHASSLKG